MKSRKYDSPQRVVKPSSNSKTISAFSIECESKSATHRCTWSSHFRPLYFLLPEWLLDAYNVLRTIRMVWMNKLPLSRCHAPAQLFMVFDAVFLHFLFIQLILAFFVILAMGGSGMFVRARTRSTWPRLLLVYTAGILLYRDSLYRNLYGMPIP